MRILMVCKRQQSGKDLIDDRFGRLYEIPRWLADAGHEVLACITSYRRRPQGSGGFDTGFRWWSANAIPRGLLGHGRWLDEATRGWRPEVVWASSDMVQTLLAARWARRHGVPCVIDLYDNYEAFGLSRLPGLTQTFRRACREAAGLTVVSHSLADHVADEYGVASGVEVVVNGVRTDLFRPRDKALSRRTLGLPADGRLLGAAGAITADRGIEDMFSAFERIAAEDPKAWLVHAGPVDHVARNHRHGRIIDLGRLPQQQVPDLLASLDVGVICNRDSAFGRYCFPLKLYEMLAMRLPLVAADVGDVGHVLDAYPQSRYIPGDVQMLVQRITAQLNQPQRADVQVPSWEQCGEVVQSALSRAAS